jgi:hypothetical protein
MRKVNINEIDEVAWSSPNGRFVGAGKQISEVLGRKPRSHDLNERHPFDVELLRISPGATPYPYHAHSAQWEFYHVVSGSGVDAFIFKPGEAHQISNDSSGDLVLYVVADNPIGEHQYYPDSEKWGVGLPGRRLIRSDPLDYFDGEE